MSRKRKKTEKELETLEGKKAQALQGVQDLIAAEAYDKVPRAEAKVTMIDREIAWRRERLRLLGDEEAADAEKAKAREAKALYKEFEILEAASKANNQAGLLLYGLWECLNRRGVGGHYEWTQEDERGFLKKFDADVAKARTLITPIDLRGQSCIETRTRAALREAQEIENEAKLRAVS